MVCTRRAFLSIAKVQMCCASTRRGSSAAVSRTNSTILPTVMELDGLISSATAACSPPGSLCACARLSYWPGSFFTSASKSASFFVASEWQPASASRLSRMARHAAGPEAIVDALSGIEIAPLDAVVATQRHDALEQLGIAHAGGPGRFGEILLAGQVRIGIGLEHEHAAVGAHAKINARAARQMQCAVNAPRQPVELLQYRSRQIVGRARGDVVAALISPIPFDLAGRDGRQRLRQGAETH